MDVLGSRERELVAATALAVLTIVPIPIVSAAAGFCLLAYFPGRLLVDWLGLAGRWTVGGRTVLATAVSLAVVPVLLNPVWHWTHDGWVLRFVAWAGVVAVIVLRPTKRDEAADESSEPFIERRSCRIVAGLVAVIVAAAVILPYWPTEFLGYPVPASVHDFVKHHAVLDSLERRPLPLGNIFFAEGAEGPAYYYHFFYLIPATVRIWSGNTLSIELAFGLAGALVALSTAGMIYLLAKRFTGGEVSAMLALLLVTVVGALDIFPLIARMLDLGRPLVVLDAWALHPYRVHNFLNQMIWSPQNVSGVLVVLVGVYVLSVRGFWRGWWLLGPVLGASALGSSVWIALGALPALAVWILTRPRQVGWAVGVAVLMGAICGPTILEYSARGAVDGRGFSVDWPINPHGALGRLVEPGVAANLFNLPTQLILEFGAKVLFLFAVPASLWRRMWRDDGLRYLCIAAVISVIALAVVRSELRHNDLGQKTVMLTMAFTAVVAAGAVSPNPGKVRWWNPLGWQPAIALPFRGAGVVVGALLLLGLPMGFYEAPMTAVRRYVTEDTAWRRASPESRTVIEAERAALRFMRYELPADAVVQAEGTPDRASLAQLVRRQIGVMEPQDDILVFDPPDMDSYDRCVEEVFGALRQSDSAAETHAALSEHRITHVFIGGIERQAWPHLERFDEGHLFRELFRQGDVAVFAVRSSK